MLKGIEPEIAQFGCILMAERAKNAAGFAGFVIGGTDSYPGVVSIMDGFMIVLTLQEMGTPARGHPAQLPMVSWTGFTEKAFL
jgi:hypothetical protein